MGSIGAKKIKAKDDPTATHGQLKYLARQDPVAAVQHPNCPPEIWWELAAKYPIEAMSSTLYWMLTLESPERWEQLERGYLFTWMKHAIARLPFREQELFAADCAEHVLYFYEQAYPGDTRVRDAIAARRRYANGQLSESEWNLIAEDKPAAKFALAHRLPFSTFWAVYYSAEASYVTARPTDGAYCAADAATNATYSAAPSTGIGYAAVLLERLWQWERVQQYARGEV